MINIGLQSKERSIHRSALSQNGLILTHNLLPSAELQDLLLQITLLLSQGHSSYSWWGTPKAKTKMLLRSLCSPQSRDPYGPSQR